jgi:hypothetical protein
VNEVVTQKDLDLLKFLTDATVKGRMTWQPTAQDNQFTASIKGKYSVLMGRAIAGGHSYFKLMDVNDQELVEVTSYDTDSVEQLFEYVRRKALDVDRAIDDILKTE